MPTPLPHERAALLSKSLAMLQERFGLRFGTGEKVELWHALGDCKRLADELAIEPAPAAAGDVDGAA